LQQLAERNEIHPEMLELIGQVPLLRRYLGEDVGILITDKERILVCINGDIKLPMKPLDKLKKGGSIDGFMTAGKKTVKYVGKEVYGIPYAGAGVPVYADGEVIGAFVTTTPLRHVEMVDDVSKEMSETVKAAVSGIAALAASAQELAASSADLTSNTRGIDEEVKNMDDIMDIITDIATQTHLLGLNAAIEAARAGDVGRGFHVVAEEIRRLAMRTRSSVKDVSDKLQGIKKRIKSLTDNIVKVQDVVDEQAATAQEVNASVAGIEPVSEKLKAGVRRLIGEQ
jgi:uncharacterized protein YoxC